MAKRKWVEKVRKSLKRKIMRDGNYTCEICGISGREVRFPRGGFGFYTDAPGIFLSVDHIIPRAAGGDNSPGNLRILCTSCNTKKGVRIGEEWGNA